MCIVSALSEYKYPKCTKHYTRANLTDERRSLTFKSPDPMARVETGLRSQLTSTLPVQKSLGVYSLMTAHMTYLGILKVHT